MADENLQRLESFKKEFDKIRLAFNPRETATFSIKNPNPADPDFINALSSTVGTIQKRLLDHDRAFLKKFNPLNNPAVDKALNRSADKISHQLGVLGVPGSDTGELLNALLKSDELKDPKFSNAKTFLDQASKLYDAFLHLPDDMQIKINADLALKPSPTIESAPSPKDVSKLKPGEPPATTPPSAAPRAENLPPPWLAYRVKNEFFEEKDYALMRQNPRDEAALQNLAQEALIRFVARAVEDGVAREIPQPAQYPAKGIMRITTDGVAKYYDTSHITEAMFGLYKKDGKTVHFKPDIRDLELAFEGLPLKGVEIDLPDNPAYRAEAEKTNFDTHKYGDHTYYHHRVWEKIFGGINDLPEADRTRIVYKMGQRFEAFSDNKEFFEPLTYEIGLAKAQRAGKERGFLMQMEAIGFRNASPFGYFRLGGEFMEEYTKSQKLYIEQRQEVLYKRDKEKTTSLDQEFKAASNTSLQEFKDNIHTAGLRDESPAAPDSPGTKSPALKNPVITV